MIEEDWALKASQRFQRDIIKSFSKNILDNIKRWEDDGEPAKNAISALKTILKIIVERDDDE